MRAVHEGLGQIDLAALAQVLGERLEHPPEHTFGDPLLHATVDRLKWWILTRQRTPRCSGPENPEHPVEHVARLTTWSAFAVLATLWLGNQRLDNTPLLVGELHGLLDHAEIGRASCR